MSLWSWLRASRRKHRLEIEEKRSHAKILPETDRKRWNSETLMRPSEAPGVPLSTLRSTPDAARKPNDG